ncbi:MAG: cysteine hydrolase family protein [Candidatus Aenigmatarchaeota archaeon]|nr:MAG: cysteine hydrolase family protein [Candidatus Aenigmarchaeota archaeon]
MESEGLKLIYPNKTSSLVIGMQNGYCSQGYGLPKLLNLDTTPIDEMIPKLKEFIGEARRNNVPVIWTRMVEDPEDKNTPENIRFKMKSEETPAITVLGKPSFEYYGIKPKEGDKQFVNYQYDAFSNTNLQKHLQDNVIESLILTGVYTSRGVDSTMRSAFEKGYHCILPEDLVAVPKQLKKEHEATLSACQAIFGYVVKSNNIIHVWENIGR